MTQPITLTLVLMDPPYESARSTTALRIMGAALRAGCNLNVFAYEGAVCLPMQDQRPHPNPVHGRSQEEEDHPLPHRWIAALMRDAEARGLHFEWVNCGMCVDERGADEPIAGVRRGSPADLVKLADASANTLIIPVK